jgi:hypothetical protein
MLQTLQARVSLADDFASDEFVMDLMERILAADDPDAIFDAQESGMISGKDYANRPFVIPNMDSIDFRPSTQANTDQNGFPFYAIIQAVEINTGENVTLNCGGKTFMAVLWSLYTLNDRKGKTGNWFDEDSSGRAFTIISTASPSGAYLSLKPFKRPETTPRGKK